MVAQIVGLFYRQRCVTYMSPSSVVFFESEIPDRHCSTKVLWSWCVSLAHTQSQRIFGTWIWHLQTNQQLGSSNCFGLYIAHFSANTMYEPLKKDLEILPFRWGEPFCIADVRKLTGTYLGFACLGEGTYPTYPKKLPPSGANYHLFRTFQQFLLPNGKSSEINISINNKTVKFWKVMTFVFSTLLLRENHTFSSPLPTGRNDLHRFAICFPEMKHTSHKKVIRKQFFEPQHHPTLVSFPDPASQIEPTRFSPEKKRSMPFCRSSPAAKYHQSFLLGCLGVNGMLC